MIATRQLQVVLVLVAACLLPFVIRAERNNAPVNTTDPDAREFALSSARLLTQELASLEHAAHARDTAAVRASYTRARRAYKQAEVLIEFYAPSNAAALNGRRPEIDDDDAPPPSLGPTGFTRLESLVEPDVDTDSLTALGAAAHSAAGVSGSFVRTIGDLIITDAQAFDAARLEVARVSVLGLAGADATPASAADEAADALFGMKQLIARAAFSKNDQNTVAARRKLDAGISAAISYLHSAGRPNSLDHLFFITEHSRAISHALEELRVAAGVPRLIALRLWRPEAPSVFDPRAFDAAVYTPGYAPAPSPALIALGHTLFLDATLGNGRSCATCHRPGHAFADGRARSLTFVDGHAASTRNTPTLIGAAVQPRQFYDERAASLEDQIAEVMRSPDEMASSVAKAAAALQSSAHYRHAFAKAFNSASAPEITERRLRVALAAYVRSLTTMSSRFDRALTTDSNALSSTERSGFNVFTGKGRCATCHFIPLFNGTAPPGYVSSDVEVIGVPARATVPVVIDADPGRSAVDHVDLHRHAFKTPTLRNIGLTAPYMHNGVFRTLEQVIDFYDAGGAPRQMRLPNRTLPPDSLHLSSQEKRQLTAFLRTLSDTTIIRSAP